MINCIAIDDEPLALEVIKSHILQVPDATLVNTFDNPIKAIDVLKRKPIDLIFLDIEMPVIDGIDFLKNFPTHCKVILTTAYRNYAIEGFELEVLDYLMKPISFPRFLKAIDKFKKTQSPASLHHKNPAKIVDEHIFVNENKKNVKVTFSEIRYIESLKDYIKIHLENSFILTKDTISNFESKLPHTFLRIHRSYIVNTNFITAFTKNDIEIGPLELPIGKSYKSVVLSKLHK